MAHISFSIIQGRYLPNVSLYPYWLQGLGPARPGPARPGLQLPELVALLILTGYIRNQTKHRSCVCNIINKCSQQSMLMTKTLTPRNSMSIGVMSGPQESFNFLVQERFRVINPHQLYWRRIKLDHCLILRSLALWSVYYDTRQREHDFKPSPKWFARFATRIKEYQNKIRITLGSILGTDTNTIT